MAERGSTPWPTPFHFVYVSATSASGRFIMRRTLRHALTGAVFILLASCGGGGPSGQDTVQPQATTHQRTVTKLSVADRERGGQVYIVRLAEPAVAGYD